jgi:hypothetical protein
MSVQQWMPRASVIGLAALVSIGMGSTAFAVSIDFTDGSWGAANGVSSYTSHSSGVDVSSVGGHLTVNLPNDGLGISNDEVGNNGSERLTIAFAGPVTLLTVSITDLFLDEFLGADEKGFYNLNGSSTLNAFQATSNSGDLLLAINASGVNSITFRSKSDLYLSDFSVKGLTYATPEPSSAVLLGWMMMFMALFLKRFSFSRGRLR